MMLVMKFKLDDEDDDDDDGGKSDDCCAPDNEDDGVRMNVVMIMDVTDIDDDAGFDASVEVAVVMIKAY